MVLAAIAISYFDRQTLPVRAISAIQRTVPLSDQQFSWLQFSFLIPYALLYAAGGQMLDVLGTRRGFLLVMLWWSIAILRAAWTGDELHHSYAGSLLAGDGVKVERSLLRREW